MTAKTILALAQAHRREPSKVNYDALADAVRLVCTALEAAQKDAERLSIKLNKAEIQSGVSRVRWAEGLIRQLPEDHDGRNSWLLNYSDAAIKAQGDTCAPAYIAESIRVLKEKKHD